MSLYPCAGCEQRKPGKLTTVYWAWLRADNTRYAAKQRLCVDCLADSLNELSIRAREEVTSCPACGIGTVEDMDPIYATVFMPGADRVEIEMATCGACAVTIRQRAQQNANALEDRRGAVGGPEAHPQPPNDSSTAPDGAPRRDPLYGLRGGL